MAIQTNQSNTLTSSEQKSDYKALYEDLLAQHQMILSLISHEVRNPVTLINSFLQLLESHHPELSQDYYWLKVMENMDFLKYLLEEFSEFNNSKTLRAQELDLAQIFRETIESAAPSIESQNITISLNVESDIPTLKADRIKLKQLILNLLRNAAEAISSQGTISCSLKCENNHILISIQDSGSGIPEEYKENLFVPFVTHKQEGPGLGLAICKRIAEAHHGSISYCSQPGKGTKFTVILPVN